MVQTNFNNSKYLEMAQMILLLGNSKKKTIYEKHKFMTLLFFLREPIFLEKLILTYNPKKIKEIEIQEFEKYNLAYEESRISILSSATQLGLSYLIGRGIISYSESGVYEEIGELCGDGNLDEGEECDDGNNEDGDGCSTDCVVEQSES